MPPTRSLLALAFVLSAAVASATPGPGDARIFDDAAAAVNGCPHFTIFDDVAVQVEDGVLTLTGKVTSGFKRGEILKRTAAVAGVRQVVDRLEVLPASSADDALRQQIARAIYGNASFWSYAVMPNPPIHIIVHRSHVTLTGVVRSDVDRRLAQALATQFNARSVTNALMTEAEWRVRRDSSN